MGAFASFVILASSILRALARERRLILLGGFAVILHGQSRMTEDYDVWLDPSRGAEDWAAVLRAVLPAFAGVRPRRLGQCDRELDPAQLAAVAGEDRIVRLTGADRPIDVFFQPNEVENSWFDEMWERAIPTDDGLRYLDEVDLLLTKQLTGREKDWGDIGFLEDKVNADYRRRLAHAGLAEAQSLLGRYATTSLLRDVLREAQSPDVRALARRLLEELSDEGDPFAAEHLRETAE